MTSPPLIVVGARRREGTVMREYEVKIGGIPHTMVLSDADAKRYGATEHKAAKPSKKAAPKPKPVVSGDDADD